MTGAAATILIATTIATAVIMWGATVRGTRLLTQDTITDPLRVAAMRRSGHDGWLYLWITCPWCVGLWLAFAVTLTVWAGERLLLDDPLMIVPGWLWVPGLALTNNYLAARALTSDDA